MNTNTRRRFKAAPGTAPPRAAQVDGEAIGIISFYPSTYNVVDLVGDVVVPGAFDKWLAEAQAKGARVPVTFAHDYNDPFNATVGCCEARDIISDSTGLRFSRAVLDLENPVAAQLYRTIKSGADLQASIGYECSMESRAADGSNLLIECTLLEGAICLFGINGDAGRYTVIKSVDPAKAGGSIRCTTCNLYGGRTHSCEHCGAARVTVHDLALSETPNVVPPDYLDHVRKQVRADLIRNRATDARLRELDEMERDLALQRELDALLAI